ncbi:luciferin 4-monooxygenase-like [Periplaneta americana]|uniref:luciferin 4-monooxygenase-like n=1 Tax=Periplaneta americana TaxID=6978 RepID=UPI0037E8C5E2
MSSSGIIKGRPIDVLPQTPIWDYIESKAKNFSSKVAQVDADTKKEITFAEILNKSKTLSERLSALGVTYGDVIVICSENNLDYCWILLAVLRAGASCALLSSTYTAREWAHALSLSRPKMVICSASVWEAQLETYLKSSNIEKIIVWNSNGEPLPKYAVSLEDILDPTKVMLHKKEKLSNMNGNTFSTSEETTDNNKSKKINTKDLTAFILSSSGSTGLPKGVVLTHFNVTAVLTTSGDYTKSSEIALGLPPFCHAYGLLLVLMCLCEGAKVVIMRKFNPDHFIKSIEEHKITCLYLVASLLVLLLKRDVLDKPECSSVRHIWTGAAPLNPKLQQLALKKLDGRATLHHSYGLTETTFTMFTCEVDNHRVGTPGKVTPGMECKVVDVDTGKVIGPKCSGELCFRGPLLMKEYIMNVEETRKAFDRDGWLHSGDLGYYDEEEYFYIVDRLKELIKYQGYQVSPSELESILVMHPDIQDAAVVGIEDEMFGELPTAFIVREPDVYVTEDQIKDYVARQVSPYKRLSGGVRFVSFIPKTATGKISRRELRKSVEIIP